MTLSSGMATLHRLEDGVRYCHVCGALKDYFSAVSDQGHPTVRDQSVGALRHIGDGPPSFQTIARAGNGQEARI